MTTMCGGVGANLRVRPNSNAQRHDKKPKVRTGGFAPTVIIMFLELFMAMSFTVHAQETVNIGQLQNSEEGSGWFFIRDALHFVSDADIIVTGSATGKHLWVVGDATNVKITLNNKVFVVYVVPVIFWVYYSRARKVESK